MIALTNVPRRDWIAYAIYVAMTLAVMLPLLIHPGFILTLDMVFTPVLRMPDAVTSSYPFHALLHVLNFVIPADILQKCLLTAVLLLSSIGLHRLIRIMRVQPNEWGIYAAGIFFAVNPFTYSRLMAGQYAVLLGYALLPWFVRQMVLFARQPNMKSAIAVGGITALIGIVSIHTLGAASILSAAALTIAVWQRYNVEPHLRYAGIAAGIFVALSSYWLVPLLLGQGKTAHIVQSFSNADTAAFATNGVSAIGKLGNIVRLQGFWAEDRMLYLLPQDRTVLWGLMTLMIIGLSITGLLWLWRRAPNIATLFAVSAIIGMILAIGWGSGLLTTWGLREPHKLVGLVALAYSVGLAYGIHALLHTLKRYGPTIYTIAAVVGIMLPLLVTRVMFWGAYGQLKPHAYPADWKVVNEQLNQDQDDFSVLFLPWHQYVSFSFSERIIANPAPAYFDKRVISSADPEFGGATSGQQDSTQTTINHALQTPQNSEFFGRQLADQHIKYVLLSKETDSHTYGMVAHNPSFTLVHDYRDITVYKNNAWRQP